MALKKKTPRSKKYLAWIREQYCVCCGYMVPDGCQAAHVRIGNGGGMGLKPSDFRTVPLCSVCHSKQHHHGERSFWNKLGDPDLYIVGLMAVWLTKNGKGKQAIAALEAVAEAE